MFFQGEKNTRGRVSFPKKCYMDVFSFFGIRVGTWPPLFPDTVINVPVVRSVRAFHKSFPVLTPSFQILP